MPVTGYMRSDIRRYEAPVLRIVPNTTRITLSDRFEILQSKEPVRPAVESVRSLQLALQTATDQTEYQSVRRLPVRQRLGPRPGVRVRNKHLHQVTGRKGAVVRKMMSSPIRKKMARSGQINAAAHQRRNQVVTAKGTHVQHHHLRKGRGPHVASGAVSRFKWQNPNLVLSQSGRPFRQRQPRASRQQLDTELDSYMSQSKGLLSWSSM